MMPLPPLRRKILFNFLLVVGLYGGFGTFLMSATFLASRITPEMIHLNYDSIAAAQKLGDAWDILWHVDDYRHGDTTRWIRVFSDSLAFCLGNVTEPGEKEALEAIADVWGRIRPEMESGKLPLFSPEYAEVHRSLARVIALNEEGMFEKAAATVRYRNRVFIIALVIFFLSLAIAVYLADGLAEKLASPLKQIAEALRNKPVPGEKLRLPEPSTLETRILTHEMNQLWKRLSELRKLNLEELSAQTSKLEIVVDSVEDAILVLDNHDNVLQCNQGLTDLVGLPAGLVYGHRWRDLPTGNANYLALRERLTPEISPEASFELDRHGQARFFSGRCRQIMTKPGEALGTVYLLHDITETKQRDRLKAEFIAVLSHELKTPLQSLGTAAELLHKRSQLLDDEARMLVDTINEDVARIRAVANEFVQVSFVDPHALRLRIGRHALDALLPEWLKPFRIVARERGVSIDFSQEGPTPVWVEIDAIRFPWAISNLMSNAIRVSPTGGSVGVRLRVRDHEILIEIRDEGPGVPESARPRMFEAFFQAEGPAESGFLGLGLTIAKEVVEAHNGFIEYEPGHPRGSVFRLRLPSART